MDEIDLKKVLAYVISVGWPENFRVFENISPGRAITLGLTDAEAIAINEAFQEAYYKLSLVKKHQEPWGRLYNKIQNKPVDDLWREVTF